MSDLHLDSLEIKNFRCFEHLVIPKLGRVNLIVGRNSVGKSSLLEGLQIFANRGATDNLADILGYRRETDYEDLISDGNDRFFVNLNHAINFLFYNRSHEIGEENPICIGSNEHPEKTLKLNVMWYGETQTEAGRKLFGPVAPESYDQFETLTPRITTQIGEQRPYSFSTTFRRSVALRPNIREVEKIPCRYIPVNGLGIESIGNLWDRAIIQQDDYLIKETLDKVVPGISEINLLTSGNISSKRPIIVVSVNNSAPLPIQTFGDGLMRAFGLSLALVNSRDGFLLIDEFETGLHHSIQTDIWRLIFSSAKLLNVQVFATTHSWDCVEAFQKAAADDQHEKAMLIRLARRKNGQIRAVSYNEEEMAIVTEQNIEVR